MAIGQLVITFILLAIIYFLTRRFTSLTFLVLHTLTRNRKFSLYFLAFLLLPGTIIHEFSHFLLAVLLRVPTGDLTVIPTIDDSGEVKAGRLFIARTDPFRHALIGLAPLIVGILIIYFVGTTLLQNIITSFYPPTLTQIIGIYVLFIISATMFSSKKDLESTAIAVPIVMLIMVSLYLVGIRVSLETTLVDRVTGFLRSLNLYLIIAALTDLFFVGIERIVLLLLGKIFKGRVN